MGRRSKKQQENNNGPKNQQNVEASNSTTKQENDSKNFEIGANNFKNSKDNKNSEIDKDKFNNVNKRYYPKRRWYSNRGNYNRRYNENRYQDYNNENGRETNENCNRTVNFGEENYDANIDNRSSNFGRNRRWTQPYSGNRDNNSWESFDRNYNNRFRYERNDTYEADRRLSNRENQEHENHKETAPDTEDNLRLRQENLNHKNLNSLTEINKLESTFETKANEVGSNNSSKTLKVEFSKSEEGRSEFDTSTEKKENKNLLQSASSNQKVKLEVKKTAKPILPLPAIKIKKEPHSNSDNKSESSSDDDSDSSLTSSNDELKTTPKIQKKKVSITKVDEKSGNVAEEEIVYMGKLKNFQNLVDEDESSNEIKKHCILCEKTGHTSFQCFMECKNCGEKYHNLKMCPKPANLSIMLQNFMEFCLQQCYQYNPEQKFTFIRDNLATELIPGLNQTRLLIDNMSNSGSMFKNTGKRKRKKENVNEYESDSESSSSSVNVSKIKKKKKKEQMQYQLPFFPMTTPSFNPLAAAAMMGFSPAAFLGKKD